MGRSKRTLWICVGCTLCAVIVSFIMFGLLSTDTGKDQNMGGAWSTLFILSIFGSLAGVGMIAGELWCLYLDRTVDAKMQKKAALRDESGIDAR